MNLDDFLSLNDKLDITVWRNTSMMDNHDVGNEFQYKSSILDAHEGKILVYFPPEDSKAFDWVEQGQKVKIMVARSNGLWSFFPTVGQFLLKGSPRVWLHLPEDIEHIQRRKHVRVKHTCPLQLQLENNTLPSTIILSSKPSPLKPKTPVVTVDNTLLLQSVDISAGGIRFKTPTPLMPGQLVTVTFTITPEFGQLSSAARIVYCFSPEELPASAGCSTFANKIPAKALQAKQTYIAAVQFIDLPRDVEKRIIQECFHLELEQHRKGVI